MVVIRYIMGLFALVLTSLVVVSATPTQAQTGASALRPNTEISQIHFKGGYFEQDSKQFGRWYEKRNSGEINFEFFETASDGKIIELTGAEGQVKMVADLNAKVVKGEWPGHPLKTIYKINGVKPMVFAKAPTAKPPAVKPPSSPATNSQAPRPQDLHFAAHAKGHFAKVSDLMWEEKAVDGQMYRFTEIGHDKRSLYLYDEGRDVLISLEPQEMQSRVSVGGERLRRLYPLTNVSKSPQTPIPAPNPSLPPVSPGPDNNMLSQAERMACTRSGGYVERAGMLGAERCTKPYSDGGQVCTDSSQCQGQCRSNSNAPTGAPASGLCQPTDTPFGCYSEIVAGRVAPGLCVD